MVVCHVEAIRSSGLNIVRRPDQRMRNSSDMMSDVAAYPRLKDLNGGIGAGRLIEDESIDESIEGRTMVDEEDTHQVRAWSRVGPEAEAVRGEGSFACEAGEAL